MPNSFSKGVGKADSNKSVSFGLGAMNFGMEGEKEKLFSGCTLVSSAYLISGYRQI